MAERMYAGYLTVVRLNNETRNFETVTRPCHLEAHTKAEVEQQIRAWSETDWPESAGWTARIIHAEELNPLLAKRGYTLTQPDLARRPRPKDTGTWKSD